MNYRTSVITAFLVSLFAFSLIPVRAPARASRMEEYLFGKWHQDYGAYSTETVLKTDFTFTSITIQRGAPYKLYVEGNWEVRGNDDELWMEWTRWEPSNLRKPLPEGTWIRVVDRNHYRNKFGDVYRVR